METLLNGNLRLVSSSFQNQIRYSAHYSQSSATASDIIQSLSFEDQSGNVEIRADVVLGLDNLDNTPRENGEERAIISPMQTDSTRVEGDVEVPDAARAGKARSPVSRSLTDSVRGTEVYMQQTVEQPVHPTKSHRQKDRNGDDQGKFSIIFRMRIL